MSSPRSRHKVSNHIGPLNTRSLKNLDAQNEELIDDTCRKNMNGFVKNSPQKYMIEGSARVSINNICPSNIRKGVGMSMNSNTISKSIEAARNPS